MSDHLMVFTIVFHCETAMSDHVSYPNLFSFEILGLVIFVSECGLLYKEKIRKVLYLWNK